MTARRKSPSDADAAWQKRRAAWRKESTKLLGEHGLTRAALVRDHLVTPKDRPAFDKFLSETGAGDHPQMLKLFLAMADALSPKPRVARKRRKRRAKR